MIPSVFTLVVCVYHKLLNKSGSSSYAGRSKQEAACEGLITGVCVDEEVAAAVQDEVALDGDTMKIEHFDVLLSKQSEKPYTGGETVQGQVEISALERVKVGRLIVKLIGQVQTGWKNKNSEVLYESNEQVLNEYVDLTRYVQFYRQQLALKSP
ncbi:unnamed protein product [Gongylonema pulchrum]|uniref:Arrestin_N domain-containing protein n=1 Tax=Gongylonema pulchrum TaxID=637853 RepID=A0A183DX71_9BILA|nr:unnamed protein product [Gongylonema pulchrum]